LSHGSALAMVGVRTPDRCTAEVHVTTRDAHERARTVGVRGHEARDGRLRYVLVGNALVVHPVDSWCQLGATLSVRELVLIGDALTRRRRPISTLGDLRRTVHRWSGRRGVQRLREALDLVRPGTDSFAETELRLDAAAAGLPEPEVNGAIVDERGRVVARGDLVYREYRTILEYDGEQHRLDDRQFARDVTRLDDIARLGWRLVRVTKAHRGPSRRARLDRVRESLEMHGWRNSP